MEREIPLSSYPEFLLNSLLTRFRYRHPCRFDSTGIFYSPVPQGTKNSAIADHPLIGSLAISLDLGEPHSVNGSIVTLNVEGNF
jgi:hypothetical protein